MLIYTKICLLFYGEFRCSDPPDLHGKYAKSRNGKETFGVGRISDQSWNLLKWVSRIRHLSMKETRVSFIRKIILDRKTKSGSAKAGIRWKLNVIIERMNPISNDWR